MVALLGKTREELQSMVVGRLILDVQNDASSHFFILLIVMKYLFIDESIDEKFYVVGGILTDSENELLFIISLKNRF